MKVKKLAKVLESDKKIAIFIDGTLETEVDKDTLMARFGQYKIKAISGGQFTETRCGKPIEVRPVLCLNLNDAEYHGTEDMDELYYCPICRKTTAIAKDGDKCPKCGATMDELSSERNRPRRNRHDK